MNNIPTTSCDSDGLGKRIALVASRFNDPLVEELVEGAVHCCTSNGVRPEDLHLVRVPGAWEIPQALEVLAKRGEVDALVALGVVIRGETAHFEYICAECCRRTSEVSRRYAIPIGFGVLTCENGDQAAKRSTSKAENGGWAPNKGWAAAAAALEMANLFAKLG